MKTAFKRSTIYLEPNIYKALKLKSIHSSRTMSDLVNDAIRLSLAEDYEDLQAFENRINEPEMDFELVLKNLKDSGRL